MLLIITNSMDGTTDLLLPLLKGKKEVFRFNVDLWSSYNIEIDQISFSLKDPVGRVLTRDSCSGLYLRKAYFLDEDRIKACGGDIETWCQYQIRSIIDSIYCICQKSNLVRLVERNVDRRLPKGFQMQRAGSYFTVPRWTITTSPQQSLLSDPVVCKSLSSAFLGEFKSLFTTKACLRDLDSGYPWLIQELIEADGDLTIIYAAGRIFSFYRKKNAGEPVDFRLVEHGQDEGWEPFGVPSSLEENIRQFMDELRLNFGRIDFLVKNNVFYFLEVNANGQFAWLDPEDKWGVLSWIAECIAV
jgi:hypothetical protein